MPPGSAIIMDRDKNLRMMFIRLLKFISIPGDFSIDNRGSMLDHGIAADISMVEILFPITPNPIPGTGGLPR